jgi:nifR3 family TIM-barrel protein
MGCPMPKIVNNHEGSALMRDIPRAASIIRELKKISDRPVTVKIRSGFNDEEKNAVEVAKALEDAGADMIAVHGRTREQYYSGQADWQMIRRVKEAVSVPVIGNGDVDSPEKAEQMMNETGCDLVMIARGARGNPWIFRQAEAILRGEECPALPELPLRLDTAVRQIEMLAEQTNEHYACLQARHQLPWYLHGVPHSGPFRQRFAKVSSLEELREITCEAGTRLSNPHISRNLNV